MPRNQGPQFEDWAVGTMRVNYFGHAQFHLHRLISARTAVEALELAKKQGMTAPVVHNPYPPKEYTSV